MLTSPHKTKLSKQTFHLDLINSSMGGILEVGFGTFSILIAIRFMEAPDMIKAILASGVSAGLLLVPLMQRIAVWSKMSVSSFCAGLMLICGGCLLWAAYMTDPWLLALALFVAQVCFSQLPGFMIQVYSRNYSPKERGKKLSWNFILSAFIGMILSYGAGNYLDRKSAEPEWIFLTMASISVLSALALYLIPSQPIQRGQRTYGLIDSLTALKEDRLFANMLLAWMVMGLGIIMTLPLRIEYLSGTGGLNLSNEQIALVTVVIFSIARIISSRLWGELFDRVRFLYFRITLNLILIAATLVYFHADGLLGVSLGAALAGVGVGGSKIAWSLWVTKLAPLGMEARYMGAHVALTGFRGALAPFLGYWLLGLLGYEGVAWFSVTLVTVSTLLFLRLFSHQRTRDSGL
ncbi:MAG: MFS transporter [Opitutae bacterium]|nr:MFS transporter [Opitutae bacterium]